MVKSGHRNLAFLEYLMAILDIHYAIIRVSLTIQIWEYSCCASYHEDWLFFFLIPVSNLPVGCMIICVKLYLTPSYGLSLVGQIIVEALA